MTGRMDGDDDVILCSPVPSVDAAMMKNSECSPRSIKGRTLFCRKCDGHGIKNILKDHAPKCPYILCECKTCEKLNYKRLKSFNKRNKTKLQLAMDLSAKMRLEKENSPVEGSDRTSFSESLDDSLSTCSTSTMDTKNNSSTKREGRSMSLGSMTVMSYDIWKARCAAEKKRLEEEKGNRAEDEKQESPCPSPQITRKRAHTFANEPIPRIYPRDNKDKKGKFVLLPTIPAIKVFVGEDDPVIIPNKDLANFKISSPPLPMTAASSQSSTNPTHYMTPMISHPPSTNIPSTIHSTSLANTSLHMPLYTSTTSYTPTLAPPLAPALSLAPTFHRSDPLQMPLLFQNPSSSLVAPTVPNTTNPMTFEQMVASLFLPQSAVMLQNSILQQQNQALVDQLFGFSGNLPPVNIPTTTVTAPMPQPDLLSILRAQQNAPPPATIPVSRFDPRNACNLPINSSDLLQSILNQTRQVTFSSGM